MMASIKKKFFNLSKEEQETIVKEYNKQKTIREEYISLKKEINRCECNIIFLRNKCSHVDLEDISNSTIVASVCKDCGLIIYD